jgi:nucleoside-diphosphate-sugar epimerase
MQDEMVRCVAELDLQEPFDGMAAHDLGYEPKWTLPRGVSDYAAWLKTREA